MNFSSFVPFLLKSRPLDILNLLDFLLLPILFAGLYLLFNRIKNKRYKDTVVAQYFLLALILRLFGAFMTACLYQYYYGYGDTTWYYHASLDIVDAFFEKGILTGLEMMLLPFDFYSEAAQDNISIFLFFKNPSMHTVVRTGSIFSALTFGSFIGASFGLTIISFLGTWMLYRVFQDLYPHLHRPLAFAVLFVPSLCFWGTGLMKDPLSLGGVGMFVYGLYFLFYKPGARGFIFPMISLFVGLYFSLVVKAYIAVAIVPAAVVWLSLLYKNKIKNKVLRQISVPFLLLMGIGFGAIALQYIGQNYSIEKIAEEAVKTQWWIALNTAQDGGTGYSLGEFDPSLSGMIKVAPAAINVALFRPYVWEARKIIVIPSAVEALFTLFFTLYVFFKVGIIYTIRKILGDPTVLFCLIFAIIFAFAVGFTSMNFGALARYKIPALPFYFSAMVILLDSKNRAKHISEDLKLMKAGKSLKEKPVAIPLQ